jgi:hypothetical protein
MNVLGMNVNAEEFVSESEGYRYRLYVEITRWSELLEGVYDEMYDEMYDEFERRFMDENKYIFE